MKYFFASLVGMLREKSNNVQELNTVIIENCKERLSLLQQLRIDEQEDILFRLKEVRINYFFAFKHSFICGAV